MAEFSTPSSLRSARTIQGLLDVRSSPDNYQSLDEVVRDSGNANDEVASVCKDVSREI